MEPTPIALVSELGNLLGLLIVYATFGSAMLAYIKPVVLNPLQERIDNPDLYLFIVFTIRMLGGALTLWFFGGVPTLYGVAPSLQSLPLPPQTLDAVVFVGAMFILSLGQEGIYVVLNILRALAGLPPMGSTPELEG